MKYIIIYFICFLIFCAWRFYEQRKSEKIEKKASDEFWAREQEANNTRKKDISHLPLLQVEESQIPVATTTDESVLTYIHQISEIIKSPMIDLSEYSNTDLKLAYGVANFKTLSEYDENYSTFLLTLSELARAYTNAHFLSQARDCYKLALYYGSEKQSDYTELAQVYQKMNTPQEISLLIREVEEGCHPHKSMIVKALLEVQKDN